MSLTPASLFTTARKALASGLAVAVAVEATGVVTGTYAHWLVQGIALATAVLATGVTYTVGNAPAKPDVSAETAAGQAALLSQFAATGSGAPSAPVPPVEPVASSVAP